MELLLFRALSITRKNQSNLTKLRFPRQGFRETTKLKRGIVHLWTKGAGNPEATSLVPFDPNVGKAPSSNLYVYVSYFVIG